VSLIIPDWKPEKWVDLPENPLIEPPGGPSPRNVIGDPQIIPPGVLDEYWHMFAWSRKQIYRLKSPDGIHWKYTGVLPFRGALPYLYREDDKWYLFYTKYDEQSNTVICMRESQDLEKWSNKYILLKPELPWEKEGKPVQVRNPCLIKIEGKYRLYYSAGTVWLKDCGYEEPKYISFAEAEDIHGPYKRYGKPIIKPDSSIPYRNFGAGAIKVYKWRGQLIGFNNGIYVDREGRSRSAICLMVSVDGVNWIDAPYNPIIAPAKGWKTALVYQLDAVYYKKKIMIYYNARDGWRDGVERIGASTLKETVEYPLVKWNSLSQ